jgi:protein-disulfide isomerase/uncharacterized membrane protein
VRDSLTLDGVTGRRVLSFLAGAGMVAFAALTIEHYFAANFPTSIWEGSICDINAFFNCDSSAFSDIAAVGGVPMGYFGLMVGALVCLGALFPSPAFERTNMSIALLNGLGIVALLLYSVLWLGSLCLLCSGYYLFGLLSLGLFWRYGVNGVRHSLPARFARPSFKYLTVTAVVTAVGAYGFAAFHLAKEQAQTGAVADSIVEQYYSLPLVPDPSVISPYWVVRSTERFEDAPIHVIEYGDLLCSDCLYLSEQLDKLEEEFAGKLNVVFQFFPLEAECNDVVDKDKHPGACELSYMAAHDPDRFVDIYHEVFANFRAAKTPEWRADLARRYGVEAGPTDPATREAVDCLIRTGAEYEKTHELYEHGIRSTPTMIINNRMVIGTLPYEQLRAIFQALVQEHEGGARFLESWVGG